MHTTIHAYVDAYGDTGLQTQKPGSTTFFIVTTVLLAGDIGPVERQADGLRQHFFQTGEMKSSGIGSNDARRIKTLTSINELPIHTLTIAVDKRELTMSKGLANRQSFFKYVHKMLFERIHRALSNTLVVADEHGDVEFMQGFKAYLDRKLPPELFQRLEFRFGKSHEEVLLQVADVISGSVARFLDPKKSSSKSDEIIRLVAAKSLGIRVWPRRATPTPGGRPVSSEEERLDNLVRDHCLRQVEIFLNEYANATHKDDTLRAQSHVLEYLLFKVEYVDDTAFVTSDELIEHLDEALGVHMSKLQLRATVISQLRDAGVIVASGPEGYKIPVCTEDIAEFVGHAQAIIPPMLSRLRKAREALRLASLGELDILSAAEFEYLRGLADVGEIGETSG